MQFGDSPWLENMNIVRNYAYRGPFFLNIVCACMSEYISVFGIDLFFPRNNKNKHTELERYFAIFHICSGKYFCVLPK